MSILTSGHLSTHQKLCARYKRTTLAVHVSAHPPPRRRLRHLQRRGRPPPAAAMSAFLSPQVQTLTPSSLAGLAGRPSPFLRRGPIPPLRSRGQFGGLVAVKAGLEPPFSFGNEASVGVAKEVWERVEGMLYTVADAAVSSNSAGAASNQSGDWLSGITDGMETVLKVNGIGLCSFFLLLRILGIILNACALEVSNASIYKLVECLRFGS